MERASDRRIRKTKSVLRSTLARLLMEKDLKDISISELTQQADINRGTFYLHYQDIYDLFEKTEQELIDDFNGIIIRHQQSQQQLNILWSPILLDAFKYISDNAELFMAILHTRETTFLNHVIEVSRPRTEKEWERLFGRGNKEFYEYYYAYITSGCVALLRRWFDRGMPETPEHMAALAEKLMVNSIRDLS